MTYARVDPLPILNACDSYIGNRGNKTPEELLKEAVRVIAFVRNIADEAVELQHQLNNADSARDMRSW